MDLEKGLFITIEGPNGVGKSSVISTIVEKLKNDGIVLNQTREPTDSPLGDFVRNSEEKYKGEILACLVAADRYHHINKVIIPLIKKGEHVISDRYVESSLVLQRLDGLSIDYIWDINRKIILPDVSVILTASYDSIKNRLSQREVFSRFERSENIQKEIKYYLDAAKFLSEKGFNIHIFNNSNITIKENCDNIYNIIKTLLS